MRVVLESGEREFLLDGPPLARGGEATVYPVPGEPGLAAKVYHRPTPERADKLAALLAARPADPAGGRLSVAWPTARLLTAGGGVVGCLMPRVADARRACELFNPRARSRICPLFHYGYLLRAARNLAAAVAELHGHGHVVGDLNDSNVLITPRALVTLVDADSFQVSAAGRVYRCRVGRPEYTPPELQAGAYADHDRRPEHDAFALAVLIFQLLMQGVHPFAGRFTGAGEPTPLPERIRAGYWPYALERDGPFQPVPHAPPWEVLPPPVGELFLRCFEEGHPAPQRRPTAAEWRHALDTAGGGLVRCPSSPQHHYPRGLDACPWCALARQQDCDPFPTAAEVEARRRSLSVLAPAAPTGLWVADAAEAQPGLDPTDPLPPAASETAVVKAVRPPTLAEQRHAVIAAGQSSWSSWLAVAAMSALIGVLLVLWRNHAASSVRASPTVVEPPARTDRPAPVAQVEPPAPEAPAELPKRPPAPAPSPPTPPRPAPSERPVPRPLPPAQPAPPPARPVPPPPSPAQVARRAAAQRAEGEWKQAVANLKEAQQEHRRLFERYQAVLESAPPLNRRQALQFWQNRLRDQNHVIGQLQRVVLEKARLWREAQAALRQSGP